MPSRSPKHPGVFWDCALRAQKRRGPSGLRSPPTVMILNRFMRSSARPGPNYVEGAVWAGQISIQHEARVDLAVERLTRSRAH
jgi:hypothetical protein